LQLLVSAGCVIPALLFVLQGYLSAKLNSRTTDWHDLVFSAADWFALAALTPIPYRLGRRFPFRISQWTRSIAIHLLGSFVFSIAWASIGMVLGKLLDHFPWMPPVPFSYLNWIVITIPFGALIYFAMLGCFSAYRYFIEAREREAEAARLATQLAETRLSALRMQLNPHFLFNSLNTVLVLVRDKENAAAARTLELIADLLRQLLETDRPQLVSLSDELRFAERYLAIEQVRFPDRLRVEWAIEERARSVLVPDLILQPLVDNAIRHGVAKRPEAGVIRISARVSGEFLELGIRDDGAGVGPEAEREGIGLSNTKERLRVLYGQLASVTISTVRGAGTEVRLLIPIRIVRDE
jgi:two-component sensor histidine kinase